MANPGKIALTDMVVPEIWSKYTTQAILSHSEFYASGILASNDLLTQLANGEGKSLNMPYLGELNGIAQGGGAGYDGTAITAIGGIEIGKNIATKIFSAASFAETDWAAQLSGADPIGAITNQLGAFWAKEQQKSLIATINGAIDALDTAKAQEKHTLDISQNVIDAAAVIDAKSLLGSEGNKISAICMHSKVYYKLVKDNLIEFVAKSEQNSEFPTYLGLRVIVDDSLVDAGGVYTSYLFANGAIGYANITPPHSVELERVADSGISLLFSRQGWVMHPYGFSYKGDFNPDNTALGNKDNWTLTGNTKAVKIARIKHKIA